MPTNCCSCLVQKTKQKKKLFLVINCIFWRRIFCAFGPRLCLERILTLTAVLLFFVAYFKLGVYYCFRFEWVNCPVLSAFHPVILSNYWRQKLIFPLHEDIFLPFSILFLYPCNSFLNTLHSSFKYRKLQSFSVQDSSASIFNNNLSMLK